MISLTWPCSDRMVSTMTCSLPEVVAWTNLSAFCTDLANPTRSIGSLWRRTARGSTSCPVRVGSDGTVLTPPTTEGIVQWLSGSYWSSLLMMSSWSVFSVRSRVSASDSVIVLVCGDPIPSELAISHTDTVTSTANLTFCVWCLNVVSE